MKKIDVGYTNLSFKKDNIFYQEKIKNGFNHKIEYKVLNCFDFVPKLLNDQEKFSEWEWIDGEHLNSPSDEDIKNISTILKNIHNSKIKFPKSNIRKRIENYRKIMKDKKIKIEIIENLYRKINVILKNMEKTTPIHGDLWQNNILKTKNNEIFIVDWEYSHMGDKHFELAYFIESFNLSKRQENLLLDNYLDFDPYILKKHKVLVNYLNVLWLYSQDKLLYSPENCIKKLELLYEEGF